MIHNYFCKNSEINTILQDIPQFRGPSSDLSEQSNTSSQTDFWSIHFVLLSHENEPSGHESIYDRWCIEINRILYDFICKALVLSHVIVNITTM